MKNNQGVTLVELLVVISVVVIFAVAFGLSYQGWLGRFRVESAAKQLHADLMIRGRARGTLLTLRIFLQRLHTG